MTTQKEIDVAELVADGHLDLDAVLDKADWRSIDTISSFVRCCYGPEGDEPGTIEVNLYSAEAYGIVAYRWTEEDDAGRYEEGPITLDRAEAVTGGEEYASDNDETPDADDLIKQIVDAGYFGDADADDIRAICEEATKHSQGYLLLPKGEFVGHPIGRMWTTNGYLQVDEYVTLDATHSSIELAADTLFRAVSEVKESEEE